MAGLDDDDAGDDPRDDEPVGPRPDPLDRPWVHPAELQSFVAAPAKPARAPPSTRMGDRRGVRPRRRGRHHPAPRRVRRDRRSQPRHASASRRHHPQLTDRLRNRATRRRERSAGHRDGELEPAVDTRPGRAGIRRSGSGTQGSGVVLRTDRVVTSAHLVDGATSVKVSTKDGTTYDAQVIGSDPTTDLCLLEVDGVGDDLPDPELTATAGIGDPVVAVAAGRGNVGWISMGVVQERNWLASNTSGTVAVAGLLATSTDTTPATSGGGLFDPNGRLDRHPHHRARRDPDRSRRHHRRRARRGRPARTLEVGHPRRARRVARPRPRRAARAARSSAT